jgi:NAD(P)-dependent dehydrogenase (short-subunit alcohol dehydrogenase family)
VVLIEPASIHSAAAGKLRRDADRAIAAFPPGGKDLYQDAYQQMIQRAIAREQRGSPPGVVAETIARALSARRPRARYLAGKDARLLATMARLMPIPVLDAVRRRLFQLPVPGSRIQPARPLRG